ncbi:MAG: UDP-N-acetylmuramoyl-tripeptide--D-alanyl-D-alanine ligase [Chloroflexi bacterium]|nr:UDP-N-acetylmuramoyl-tripeptide--D-alanyl-D-alanine ligase [Chloroflexota bacterium]
MTNGLTLATVRAALPDAEVWPPDAPALAIAAVTHDSRLATPGALFVALRGARDGHTFIADAVARGAVAALGERPLAEVDAPGLRAYVRVPDALAGLQRLAAHWRAGLSAAVVGVTGSVGKTSTKDLIAHVLGRRWAVLRSSGNYNNEIGLPLTLLALRAEHRVAVLEMGMYAAGEIALLCALARPTIGVVTNVGPVHMERLGSLEAIAAAKAELVEALPSDGQAILNGDDERVRAMAGRTAARVLTYGRGSTCDVRLVEVVTHGLDGLGLRIEMPAGRLDVRTPLAGAHHAYTVGAATATALALGMQLAEIGAALDSAPATLRLTTHRLPGGALVLDDTYNASPASVLAALDLLATCTGRRVAILGDMFELGEAEELGHRAVGRRAAAVVDELWAVGERARWITEEARAHGLGAVHLCAAKAEVDYVPRPGDAVLLKASRGMRFEELVERLLAVGAQAR